MGRETTIPWPLLFFAFLHGRFFRGLSGSLGRGGYGIAGGYSSPKLGPLVLGDYVAYALRGAAQAGMLLPGFDVEPVVDE